MNLDKVNQFQYIFLGGFLGEVLTLPALGDYLKINCRVLNTMGVKDVDYFTLSSRHTAHHNAKELGEIIKLKLEKNTKKIVLIAHSKACLESVLCLIKNLDLFSQYIEKIICVQPPFKGSTIFENIKLMRMLGTFWPGLACLDLNFYSEYLNRNFKYNKELQLYLNNNLLVIRGFGSSNSSISWIIRGSHYIMKRKGKVGDGLVAIKDQILPGINHHEVNMEIDHSDLFTSTRISKKSDDFRSIVMKCMLSWVTTKNFFYSDEVKMLLSPSEEIKSL